MAVHNSIAVIDSSSLSYFPFINLQTINQMVKSEFYNGILYQIEYQPKLSNNDYTQHKVYHIKTEDENYPHARKAIASIMEDLLGYEQGAIWNKGLYQLKNDKEPSMANALHVYYEFSYNEELDVYVYTFVRPYDD